MGHNEEYSPGDSISDSSENLLQKKQRQRSAYCSETRGTYDQTHILAEGYCWSQRADVTFNDFTAFLDMRRYKNWACIFSWKHLLKTCSVSSSQSTKCLIPDLCLNSFQWVLMVSRCSGSWFNLSRGRQQMSIFSWQYVKLG